MSYTLTPRPNDMIAEKPDPSTGLDTLLTYEITSGARFGVWCTRDNAQRTRDSLVAAWDDGRPLAGSIQLADVAVPSSAVVAVYLAPDDAPSQGVTNGAGGTT